MANNESLVYDVLIIGGGPAGASAAIYAARAKLKTLVVDKGLRTGALGMSARIANYPGLVSEVAGADLIAMMRAQAVSFGAEFVQDRVLNTDLYSDPKTAWCSLNVYQARSIVIASGSMGPTHLVPGEERLVGRGVSYCATCDGAFFSNQDVAVVGSNEETVEEALLLTRFARQVHLLVPTPALAADAELIQAAEQNDRIQIYFATRMLEIVGDDKVTGVRIVPRGKDAKYLPVSGVFVYLQGGKPITDFVAGQVEMDEAGCLLVDEAMQTTVPGIFAVGDVLCTHLKQVVVSAAEGAIAAVAAERYLSGRKNLRPDWTH